MNALEITYIVISSVIIAYVLGFLINLAFVNVFLRKFNEHNHALSIALMQKYEMLSSLLRLLKKNDVSVPEELIQLFESINIKDFETISNESCLTARNNMSLLKQEIVGICKSNELIVKNGEYKNLVSTLTMVDDQIRYLIVSYNADVIGYNYWINFRPYVYIFILSGVEKKDII